MLYDCMAMGMARVFVLGRRFFGFRQLLPTRDIHIVCVVIVNCVGSYFIHRSL